MEVKVNAHVPVEVRELLDVHSYGAPWDKVANAAVVDAIKRHGWGEMWSVCGVRSDVRADEAVRKMGGIIVARDIAFGDCRGECTDPGSSCVVALIGDSALLTYDDDENQLRVVARTQDEAERTAKAFLEHFPVVAKIEPDETEAVFEFNFRTSKGTSRYNKRITTGRWADIRGNYPSTFVKQLDSIVQMTTGPTSGRLCLLRGPTGTGKTYFLLCLAREWQEWAAFSYVMDPERFFGDPSYMMEAVLRAGGHDENDPRWRVLVMEDVDEFIHGTSSSAAWSNGGVARLLNLAEGLIGSGTRLLLFLTTNEQHGTVHPAVARKGRSFADVQFDLFPIDEAQAWLTQKGDSQTQLVRGPALYSLADLFQLKGNGREG